MCVYRLYVECVGLEKEKKKKNFTKKKKKKKRFFNIVYTNKKSELNIGSLKSL